MKPIAVVILNWNGCALLERYLPEVIANTSSDLAEIVIVDNGSTDASLASVKANYPHLRWVQLDRNYGFAGGYNRGLEALEQPYYLLLNSDVSVPKGWIEPLWKFMETHPQVAACQPKLCSDRDRDLFEHAGAAGGFLDRYGYPFCRGRIFDTVESDQGQYDREETPIFWGSGAALLVRREDFWRVGGFDDAFFAHMEEIDLCWRLQLMGKGVANVPESTVYHLGGATLEMGNPRKVYLNFRNSLWMLYKNLPRSVSRRKLRMRHLYDAAAFLRFSLRGEAGAAMAILKAYRDYYRGRSRYVDFPKKDILSTTPQGRCNITVARFLQGKKHYSDLFPS